MNVIRIFLLEPINKKDQFDTVLIWSDNESDARNKSGHVRMGGRKNVEPENFENVFFYKSHKNANCTELNGNDYKIESQQNHEIVIIFRKICYELTKNEPEIILTK